MYKERFSDYYHRALDMMHNHSDFYSNNYELWDVTSQAFIEAIAEHNQLEARNKRQAKKLQEFYNMSVIDFIKYKFKQIKLPRLSITWK
tara:strand:+ start:118 stop:384 length:267 start_codon:yes stop_codon:yes gene_type:complete